VPRIACRALAVLVLALALGWLTALATAEAGSYSVRQCDWASGNGHHDFVWQASGVPTIDPHAGSGCGEFGLAARNGGGGTQRSYPSGAYGGWFAYAPLGTVFTRFAGAFGALQGCCVSGMTGYGEATQQPDGQGGRAYLFQGHLGDQSWYSPSGLSGPVGRSWNAGASGFDARRVGFQLRCGPGFSCTQGIYADLRLRGRSFDFTLRDDAAPVVAAPGGTLVAGGWRRGPQSLAFAAEDSGGGLTAVEAAFDDGTELRSPSSCAVVAGSYARLQPCPPQRTGAWTIDTTGLPDGARRVELRATDAGGTTTRRAFEVSVDNGAPAMPREATVIGGDGWRSANGFEVVWENPPGQHAPIARARWQACPASGAAAVAALAGCVEGEHRGIGIRAAGPITLPAAGEWNVQVWLEDAAGNADRETATAARRLRFDPEPPALRFLPADPGAPERFHVVAHDLSGIATAAVELRRYGSEHWTAVPTDRHGELLIAALPERQRVGGAFDIRVRATDAAGNEGVGHGGVRTLRARTPATSRPKRLPRARATMAVRVPSSRRRGDSRPRRRWSRRLRRATIAGGRPVLFAGRVGRPVPRHGKLVEVQAHFRGRWRTISAVRARRDGRWRFRYVFRSAAQREAYRLRARVPIEAGYPFSAGTSRAVRVTVLPVRR
jgi:hypothetical protein